jgi:hypothetical protein
VEGALEGEHETYSWGIGARTSGAGLGHHAETEARVSKKVDPVFTGVNPSGPPRTMLSLKEEASDSIPKALSTFCSML